MRIEIIPFEQPIGEFALGVMSVNDILSISYIDRREFDVVTLDSTGGPQRQASSRRINEIASYSETPDATFPTPILLALPENSYTMDGKVIELAADKAVASIVDGQHRVLGLERSQRRNEYVLPVVFVLDATEEQKALIFAIINGKQTRVSGSVIYDLFSVVEGRNPYKTAHEVARALNSDPSSPFYRRLKMLGRKVGQRETLSQGTFVTQLLKHISGDPAADFNRARSNQPLPEWKECVFSKYFVQSKDEVIVRILFNMFLALKKVFPTEWEDPGRFVLTKTTGYTGIMKALPAMEGLGRKEGTMSAEFFEGLFTRLKLSLENKRLQLTSSDFPPNNTGESKLRDLIIEICSPQGRLPLESTT